VIVATLSISNVHSLLIQIFLNVAYQLMLSIGRPDIFPVITYHLDVDGIDVYIQMLFNTRTSTRINPNTQISNIQCLNAKNQLNDFKISKFLFFIKLIKTKKIKTPTRIPPSIPRYQCQNQKIRLAEMSIAIRKKN
jgi:hypothetical protein